MEKYSQPSLFGGEERLSIDALDLAALSLVPGLGFIGIRRLVETFRDLHRVWSVEPHDLELLLREAKIRATPQMMKAIISTGQRTRAAGREELERLAERRSSLITISDPLFPKTLFDARPIPYWLYVEGNAELLGSGNHVAVVGTRQPTQWGVKMARSITSWLISRGVIVVSGLAEGIDEAAQQTCADAAAPTIAVLGHGINVTFPASTAILRGQILQTGGAVISEYLPNDRYEAQKFVQRNRIQAALSTAVIPIEAEFASGTAHTVRFAAKYQRRVVGIGQGQVRPGILRVVHSVDGAIVDLDVPGSDEMLAAELGLPPTRPIQVMYSERKRQITKHFAKEFVTLMSRYDMNDEDLDFLTHEIKRVKAERLDLHEYQGNSDRR